MKRSEVIKIIAETYSVDAEYLWDGETHAVFRHPVSNKWFGIIMEVKKKNLHIEGCEKSCETEDVMNVKVNPILIEDLLHEETFLPAYHMNKKNWVSIRLELIKETALKKFIDESWNLVKPKVKKTGWRVSKFISCSALHKLGYSPSWLAANAVFLKECKIKPLK